MIAKSVCYLVEIFACSDLGELEPTEDAVTLVDVVIWNGSQLVTVQQPAAPNLNRRSEHPPGGAVDDIGDRWAIHGVESIEVLVLERLLPPAPPDEALGRNNLTVGLNGVDAWRGIPEPQRYDRCCHSAVLQKGGFGIRHCSSAGYARNNSVGGSFEVKYARNA